MDITEEKLIQLYDAIYEQPYVKIIFLLKDLDLPVLTVNAMKRLNYIGFEDGKHYWKDETIPIDNYLVTQVKAKIKQLNKRKK